MGDEEKPDGTGGSGDSTEEPTETESLHGQPPEEAGEDKARMTPFLQWMVSRPGVSARARIFWTV